MGDNKHGASSAVLAAGFAVLVFTPSHQRPAAALTVPSHFAAVAGDSTMPPAVLALLEKMPWPATGTPAIATKFSHDTVSVGGEVELVTVTWFPRELRDRIRRLPIIKEPTIAGLPANANRHLPRAMGEQIVAGQLVDRYVSWQSVPTVRSGRIEAAPAVLAFQPPPTLAFSRDSQTVIRSSAAVLVVRPK